MKGLFGYEVPEDDAGRNTFTRAAIGNPMVKAYGRYWEDNVRCKDCKHLFYKQYANRYYKCELRGDTGGAGTDHRKYWPACMKFEKKNNG